MTDYQKKYEKYLDAVELAMSGYLPAASGLENDVADAMRYSLLSGGKRVRAVLLFACCEMSGGDYKAAVPFAAGIEMVHAYSLIHDDLPCMDDDDMRRGKLACHIAFGEATALLAGDGLLTLAFETYAKPENVAAFGAKKALDSVRILSKAAGANGMIGGQMLDMANENNSGITVETLMKTDEKKTGALIKAACEIGCVLGGANEKVKAHVREYASKLGLAFQIRDDILDVEGSSVKLGKPTGSDSQNNKATYASLYGVKKADEIAHKLTSEAIDELAATSLDAKFLISLANALAGRKY